MSVVSCKKDTIIQYDTHTHEFRSFKRLQIIRNRSESISRIRIPVYSSILLIRADFEHFIYSIEYISPGNIFKCVRIHKSLIITSPST